MHACKIREPEDAKRGTLVEVGYDLGRTDIVPLQGAAHASE
jgi:hypothetical protein